MRSTIRLFFGLESLRVFSQGGSRLNMDSPRSSSSQLIVLQTHTPALFKAAVTQAAVLLRAGELVALPTETVYGLAANALSAEAVSKIFQAKDRPETNPIILHVNGLDMAKACVTVWPVSATLLAKAFWPGPLTLVLPKANCIPDNVTAGGKTVGIRWPSHPFMHEVIGEAGFPLAAPSANRSNEISPTNAEHVRKSLGDKLLMIVDGGQSQVGIESTVVDLSGPRLRVLRPGIIHATALQSATPGMEWEMGRGAGGDSTEPLRSPGQLLRHYSPKARLVILNWKNSHELSLQLNSTGINRQKIHLIVYSHVPGGLNCGRVSVIPHDAEAFARAIYAELHQCDEEGAELIVVEALPDSDEWVAIGDRLIRASAR